MMTSKYLLLLFESISNAFKSCLGWTHLVNAMFSPLSDSLKFPCICMHVYKLSWGVLPSWGKRWPSTISSRQSQIDLDSWWTFSMLCILEPCNNAIHSINASSKFIKKKKDWGQSMPWKFSLPLTLISLAHYPLMSHLQSMTFTFYMSFHHYSFSTPKLSYTSN